MAEHGPLRKDGSMFADSGDVDGCSFLTSGMDRGEFCSEVIFA
jgi:hypothetical protein